MIAQIAQKSTKRGNMKKFNKKTVERIVGLIKSDTYTIAEVCQMVGISTRTFYLWQEENIEFAQAISDAREELRQFLVCEAQKSLLKKIQGYTVDETKVVTVPSNEMEIGKDGKPRPKPKIKEQTTTKKHIAPDTAAIIFTLTNREPETWKNRIHNEITGKDGKDLFKQMSDDELNAKIGELERKLGK